MQPGQFTPETPVDSVGEKITSAKRCALLTATIWPGVLFIVLATLIAYAPVYSAGFIWDDHPYVTDNQCLHDGNGLWKIWGDATASPQYYPLVFTSFWLEYHLWGLNPCGFHVVNVLLHILAALLLWRALVRLKLPGAWFAAALFALHPVQVESVAWITERKNVLSAVFYFLAVLAYLRFSGMANGLVMDRRRWGYYAAALLLFVASLLSKTVTCTLPVVLLLLVWWKQGRLAWRFAVPLAPFFLAAIGMGLITTWVEKNQAGAQGADWSLTFAERCLVAARALCFYATKLVFPVDISFIYSRWNVDAGVWWQWLFPLVFIGVVAALWLARQRIGRGPLAAVLFFAATLAPALGFLNVAYMRYSFVADHFQYLACVGLIVLVASRLPHPPKILAGGLLLVLGVMTWQRCGVYQDQETIWSDTLKKNPACWLAHTNLGRAAEKQGDLGTAKIHFQSAVQIAPAEEGLHYDYGNLLVRMGQLNEALEQYGQAVKLDPANPEIHNNLGAALLRLHRGDEAVAEYRQAIRLQPDAMSFHYNLGSALATEQKTDEAVAEFERALQLAPDSDMIKRRLRALGATVN